jgi:hypothetical protein
VQWITSCRSPNRSIDDCALSVPSCKTSTPWMEDAMCCPASCYTKYKTSRIAGMAPLAAMLETYIDDGSCIPQFTGLRALRTGVPTAPSCGSYTINKQTGIGVDDDLLIALNGVTVYDDDDHLAIATGPATFNACKGDSLRFVATNWFYPCAGVPPLEITRNSDGASLFLDPVGFNGGCDSSVPADPVHGYVFYDKIFQIPF